MNQAVLGALLPFALAAIAYAARGGRASWRMLALTPVAMAAGALWAVAPDLPRALGMADLYQRLAHDPRTDIFFWHYTIDQRETDSSLWNIAAIAMAVAMLWAAWRELRRREGGGRE